jgi:hypothetical protein
VRVGKHANDLSDVGTRGVRDHHIVCGYDYLTLYCGHRLGTAPFEVPTIWNPTRNAYRPP